MSIDKSPPPAPSHPGAASRGSTATRGKAVSADAPAPSAAAGFTSILGALGDAAADAGAPVASTAPLGAAVTLDEAAPDGAGALPFDAGTWLQQNPQIAAAQGLPVDASATAPALDPALLAQAAGLLANAMAPAVPQPPLQPEWSSAAATAPTALAAPDAASANRTAGPLGASGSPEAATTAADDAPAPDLAESAAHGLQHARGRARANAESLQATAQSSIDTGRSAATAAEHTQPNRFLVAIEQARAQAAPRTPESVLAALLLASEKAPPARAALGPSYSEPTYSAGSVALGSADFSPSAAPVAALAPALQVAEQVSYWVSHHVQNAELSLDGLGESPVQVRISLQGNEAHISFHTDEAATREVLQSAGLHLKDLLQREGLVLTGVSVGTADSGSAGERRGRPNVRQTAIAPVHAARMAGMTGGAGTARATPGGAGRSVDLFV
jgi:flagellar hook-length control protein FliK